jgi:hypothetical protein
MTLLLGNDLLSGSIFGLTSLDSKWLKRPFELKGTFELEETLLVTNHDPLFVPWVRGFHGQEC